MNLKAKLMMALAVMAAAFAASATVKLGMPFSDHMVLQRDKPVAVWGTAEPGEKVTVTFAGQSAETVADAQGGWRVNLKPMPASKEGRTLTANDVKVQDVLVGEVWFAGGQSNMGVPLVWVDPRHGELVGTDVIVSAKGVEKPVKLRYLHADPWYGALYNEVNLPVGAFHVGD